MGVENIMFESEKPKSLVLHNIKDSKLVFLIYTSMK